MAPFLIPVALVAGGYVVGRGIEAGVKALHNAYKGKTLSSVNGAEDAPAAPAAPAATPSEPSTDAPAEAAIPDATTNENAPAEAVAKEIEDLGRGLEALEAEFAALKAAAAENKRASWYAEYQRALEALDAWMSTQSLSCLVDAMRVFRVAQAAYAAHAAEELQAQLSAVYAQRALMYSSSVAAFLSRYEAEIVNMPAGVTPAQRDVLLARIAQVTELAEADCDLALLYIPARQLEERVRALAALTPLVEFRDAYIAATTAAYQYVATAPARMSVTQRKHAEGLLEQLDAAEQAFCANGEDDAVALTNGAEARRLITKRISKARKG